MMASPVILVLLVYLGASQEVFGMPGIVAENSKSPIVRENQEEKSYLRLGQELIETADIFLTGLTDKYSHLNDQIEKAISEYDGSSIDKSTIDCSSPEAIEMKSMTRTFDYCNNMTLELNNLKKTSAELIKAFQEIGVSTSMLVSGFYDCSQKPNPFIQASCIMSIFVELQSSYSMQKPKFQKLYAKLLKCYGFIYTDMWQCFYSSNTYSRSIPKMAQYSVMCN